MSKRNKDKFNNGRAGDGSPIETRCQARGLITVDRPKHRSRFRCRSKGRQGNPKNREW